MPLVFNQEAINGILFTLHFQKDTPIVAHQKLMGMTGKKAMDLDQVTEFFKKIDNGEFRLKEEVEEQKPEVTLAQILNVPDFVVKYLDIDARLRLRKTCTIIREMFNEKMLHIDCLSYTCKGYPIKISTNRGFNVSYKFIEGGVSVKYCNRVTLINAKILQMDETIQRDLMSILCSEKLRIDTFRIENDDTSFFDNEIPPPPMRALRNTLNQVSNKLKISHLDYCVKELDSVFIETLKTIDPEHLKFLKLSFNQVNSFFLTTVWKDLHNLNEWKCLKSIDVCFWGFFAIVSDIIKLLSHVENARLKIQRIYLFQLTPLHNFVIELIEKFLQNPNLKQLKIKANLSMRDSDFEDIKASLQQYNTNNAPFPCWVSIPYPDSDNKLELLVKKKMIWFKGPCYVEDEESDEDDDDEEEDEDEMMPLNALNLNNLQ